MNFSDESYYFLSARRAAQEVVEHLSSFQPSRLRRTVQLPEVTERSLVWTTGRSHCLYQRPVAVLLAVLPSGAPPCFKQEATRRTFSST
jgi:hypothetical protein